MEAGGAVSTGGGDGCISGTGAGVAVCAGVGVTGVWEDVPPSGCTVYGGVVGAVEGCIILSR